MMAGNGLVKLNEECGELVQIASKKLAYFHTDDHPDGESIKIRLENEIADVFAAATLVIENFGLDKDAIDKRGTRKLETFRRWHADPSNEGEGANL